MRLAHVVFAALLLFCGVASSQPAPAGVAPAIAAPTKAQPPATPAPGSGTQAAAPSVTPHPDIVAILTELAAAPDHATRRPIVERLLSKSKGEFTDGDEAAAKVAALTQFLARARSPEADPSRCAVLTAIAAAVPDANGKFVVPPRLTTTQAQADNDLDWLAELLRLSERPELGNVIADVAALRALAATNTDAGAQGVFDAAFAPNTMMYRDECGRYLRKMLPASLPMLTRESQGQADRRRYANYQLERTDRQSPAKALDAARSEEAIMVAILHAFETTKHREAVHDVFARIGDDSPRVRAAARAAWEAYIVGPPPKPAPKKKLQLSGGRVADKETPLWLTYRELADNELRLAARDVLGLEVTDTQKLKLLDVTKQLYAHYDEARQGAQRALWATARAKADQGDLEAAVQLLRQVLANDPNHPDGPLMASVFLAYGHELERGEKWAEAAEAYSAAAGLKPADTDAQTVLASYYFALGKALEAKGQNGQAAFRKAMELRPQSPIATKAAVAVQAANRPLWMKYAAAVLALLAVAFAAIALRRSQA